MRIIHISDIHWRGIQRHREYNKAFEELYRQLRELNVDLIVNTGDTFHTKTQGITPEIIERLAWMFRSLADIAPTYTLLGNHDGNLTNLHRKDIITPIHESIDHPKAHLLRKSGVYKVDDLKDQDVYIGAFSPFDQKGWPSVKPVEGAINIALYHGSVAGSVMDNNWTLPWENCEAEVSDFTKFDFALLGDIHKQQYLAKRKDKNGVEKPWMGYPGSLIQQNFGETETKGYLVWDIRTRDDWDVSFKKLENYSPFVTIHWEGTVDETIKKVVESRGEKAFLPGARFRVSSSFAIPSIEARKLVHDLREVRKASEVTFKYDIISKMDHVESNSLKISKKGLRQDPDAVVRLYLDYIRAHAQNYHFDIDQLDEAENLIRGYMSKLMVREADSLTKNCNWSIKSLEFDNIFRYGEGNRINFNDLEGVVGVFGPNRIGKALDINTPIPTINGWKTIESITTNDFVFDSNGRPCRVTAKSPIYTEHKCYELVFSDGTKVVADADHQWIVNDHKAMAKQRKLTKSHKKVVTTKQMFESQTFSVGKNKVNHWSITNCSPVQYPKRFLPLDPYVLGCWLGDGHSHSSEITCFDEEILENIKKSGETILEKKRPGSFTVKLLSPRLRSLGVLGNKHIPSMYMIASVPERISLLQGLMDTDGSCSKSGLVEFCQCDEKLAHQVKELACSLGFKTTIRVEDAKLYGKTISKRYRVSFTPHKNDICPFRLSRKANRIRAVKNAFADRTKRRYVVDIKPVPSIPVQCLVVDSPDHSFLFGRNYVPTHNSSIVGAIMYALYNTTDRGPMKTAHIINKNKNYCKAKVRISVGGTDYIIERQSQRVIPKRNKRKYDPDKTTTTLNFCRIEWDEEHGVEKKISENSISRDDTDKQIRNLIGTSNDFLLTALSSQGSVDKFIKEGPTDRKKILARFLELDIFEKLYSLCKDDYNSLNSKGSYLSPESIVNQIKKARKRASDLEKSIEVLTERIFKHREQKDEIKLWLMHHEKSAAEVDLAQIDALEKKIKELEDKYMAKSTELEKTRKTVRDTGKALKTTTSAKRKYNIDVLNAELESFEALKATMHELKHELNSQKAILENQKKNVKKLNVVPCGDQFPDCHYIRDGHRDKKKVAKQAETVNKLSEQYSNAEATFEEYIAKRIKESIEEYRKLDREEFELSSKLESARNNRNHIRSQITSIKAEIKKTKKELVRLQKTVDILEGKEFERKKESLDRIRDTIHSLESKKTDIIRELGGQQESLKRLLLEEEETKSLIKKLKIYDSIVAAFSKTGIPAMVLKSQLPAINQELNKILEGIVEFKISLETDVKSNVMDVYIEDGHSSRIIELASGMEKTLASLALRVALSNLSSLPKSDILIIDEGFGALDEENIQSSMEMLTFLRGYFKTILVISHVTQIKEVADRIIEVKNDGTESKVTTF